MPISPASLASRPVETAARSFSVFARGGRPSEACSAMAAFVSMVGGDTSTFRRSSRSPLARGICDVTRTPASNLRASAATARVSWGCRSAVHSLYPSTMNRIGLPSRRASCSSRSVDTVPNRPTSRSSATLIPPSNSLLCTVTATPPRRTSAVPDDAASIDFPHPEGPSRKSPQRCSNTRSVTSEDGILSPSDLHPNGIRLSASW